LFYARCRLASRSTSLKIGGRGASTDRRGAGGCRAIQRNILSAHQQPSIGVLCQVGVRARPPVGERLPLWGWSGTLKLACQGRGVLKLGDLDPASSSA
jgi:hypothetical protein